MISSIFAVAGFVNLNKQQHSPKKTIRIKNHEIRKKMRSKLKPFYITKLKKHIPRERERERDRKKRDISKGFEDSKFELSFGRGGNEMCFISKLSRERCFTK
jgi:hypothetical protein